MTELIHLLTDPAHWAFEGITDVVFGAVGALVLRRWVAHHDATAHPKEH